MAANNQCVSRQITVADARKMHELSDQGLYQHQIAALFGVNQGRVCEVLKGKRFPELLDSDREV